MANLCAGGMDRIEVRGRRKSSAVSPQEERRHTVSEINRAVIMKNRDISYQEMQYSSGERLKIVGQRKGVDKTGILSHPPIPFP